MSLPRNSSTPSPTLLHVTNKDTKSLSHERMKSTLLLTWLLVACPSLLLLYSAAVPTLPFHPRWQKGIQCHPIMDLCVVQKHRDARPSIYVKKNKYLYYKCIFFFFKHGTVVELLLDVSRCSQPQLAIRSGRGIFICKLKSIFSVKKSVHFVYQIKKKFPS